MRDRVWTDMRPSIHQRLRRNRVRAALRMMGLLDHHRAAYNPPVEPGPVLQPVPLPGETPTPQPPLRLVRS